MKPVALIVLDGWGHRAAREGNAVLLARTPVVNRLWETYPHCFLQTSGLAVGLPDGVMGNSEVGHLNIGAGRVVYQELTRIGQAIQNGEFARNPILAAACAAVRKTNGVLHCMGLVSDGGVHSHIDHLIALLTLAKEAGVLRVAIHAFMDGRDTSPTAGVGYCKRIQQACRVVGNAAIATVSGRYYAMDRDKRWERTEQAFAAVAGGRGKTATDPIAAVAAAYAEGITDEFLVPTVITREGMPVAPLRDGDGVIFFNFRGDRARQITRAIALPDFAEFPRAVVPQLATFTCFTEYDRTFPFPVAFRPEPLTHLFGDVVSQAGLKQLRIAETEKYAHVTFFFNGGEERLYPGEDRCLIPSPRDVPTYDQKPAMSAREVTAEAVRRINENDYDAIILNFANPDMVGHTGKIPAAVCAVETVDTGLGEIVEAVLAKGGALLVTADHGNCEEMLTPDGHPHTSHTTNPVPCILVADSLRHATLREGGKLCDLAPTLLQLLGVPQPKEMTGVSLLTDTRGDV